MSQAEGRQRRSDCAKKGLRVVDGWWGLVAWDDGKLINTYLRLLVLDNGPTNMQRLLHVIRL